jgi:hypothetical protein
LAAAKPRLSGRHFALSLKAPSSNRLVSFKSGFKRSYKNPKKSISHVASAAHHNRLSNVSGITPSLKYYLEIRVVLPNGAGATSPPKSGSVLKHSEEPPAILAWVSLLRVKGEMPGFNMQACYIR